MTNSKQVLECPRLSVHWSLVCKGCHFPFIIPLLMFPNVSTNQLYCFFFKEALSSMALFHSGLSFIIFADFSCCHDCFIGNVLSLKKEYLKFLFLGLIFAGSGSSSAQALCGCQSHSLLSLPVQGSLPYAPFDLSGLLNPEGKCRF